MRQESARIVNLTILQIRTTEDLAYQFLAKSTKFWMFLGIVKIASLTIGLILLVNNA